MCQKAGNALRASPRARRRAQHRALHSPSMVASTAPPGQNSIMIWENKERGIKVRSTSHQAKPTGYGRGDKSICFCFPAWQSCPFAPYGDAEASVLPRTHPPGIPSTNDHPSSRDRSCTRSTAALWDGASPLLRQPQQSHLASHPVPGRPPRAASFSSGFLSVYIFSLCILEQGLLQRAVLPTG